MTDTIKKYLKKTFYSEEELDAALEECGVTKRIVFHADLEYVQEMYTIFIEKAGYWIEKPNGLRVWIGSSAMANEILGGDYFHPDDLVTSFMGNVILDILIKQQEAEGCQSK